MKRLVLALLLVGCPKPQAEASDAAPAGDAAPSPPAEGGAGAATASTGIRTFDATYTLTVGTEYVSAKPEWSGVKFKDDPSKFMGDGSLLISLAPDGTVSGTSEADPLGKALLSGRFENSKITGTFRRKEASDSGLTGTLEATITGDKLEGEMKLSEGRASIVRLGKLTGTKK